MHKGFDYRTEQLKYEDLSFCYEKDDRRDIWLMLLLYDIKINSKIIVLNIYIVSIQK